MSEFDWRVNSIGRARAVAFFLPRLVVIAFFAIGIAIAAYYGATP